MELSKRLQAVADLVTEGASVADIGTDPVSYTHLAELQGVWHHKRMV